MKYLILTILPFLYLISQKVECRSGCPNFSKIANFSDPVELKQHEERLLPYLWSTPLTGTSPRMARITNLLFKMVNNTNHEEWRSYGFSVSEWFWCLAPVLDRNPNLCPIAKMIDATIEFDEDNDCDKLKEALIHCQTTLVEAAALALDNAIENIGCSEYKTKELNVTEAECPENGLEFKMAELWDRDDNHYHKKLRLLVDDLGRSKNKLDKLLQLVLTVNLSPHFRNLSAQFSDPLKYQLFYMMRTKSLPQSCCRYFIRQSEKLLDRIKNESENVLQLTLKNAGC